MRASVIMENAYALAQHPPSPVLNYNLMTWHVKWLNLVSRTKLSWGGVKLSPLGTSATNWPVLLVPDDRWICSSRWNGKYSKKTCTSVTFYFTNATRPVLDSNLGRQGGNLATKRLSSGTSWTQS
jgi:hypothetical protein